LGNKFTLITSDSIVLVCRCFMQWLSLFEAFSLLWLVASWHHKKLPMSTWASLWLKSEGKTYPIPKGRRIGQRVVLYLSGSQSARLPILTLTDKSLISLAWSYSNLKLKTPSNGRRPQNISKDDHTGVCKRQRMKMTFNLPQEWLCFQKKMCSRIFLEDLFLVHFRLKLQLQRKIRIFTHPMVFVLNSTFLIRWWSNLDSKKGFLIYTTDRFIIRNTHQK
jgi:hypothetical protein